MGLPEHTTASHLVAKHLLQLPIGLGGLGFTSEQHFGDAALFAAIVTAKRVRELLFPAAPQNFFRSKQLWPRSTLQEHPLQ